MFWASGSRELSALHVLINHTPLALPRLSSLFPSSSDVPMPNVPASKPFLPHRPSLLNLPPELLLSIATLLPLTSLNALISSSRLFRGLHALTIREPSFCPWRRRYEFHRNAYEAAYNSAELRAYTRRISSETNNPELRLSEPHVTQSEYESVVEGFMRDFGFSDPEGSIIHRGGLGDSSQNQNQRRRFLLLDEKVLLEALMGMWRNKREERNLLRLKNLRCDMQMLEMKLERLCPWRVIGIFAPEDRSGVEWPQSMMIYVLLTVYLLYGGLQPTEIPGLIASCSPPLTADLHPAYGDPGAAICEYFCFLALFLDIWEAQFMMLELARREAATVLQTDLWYHGNLRRGLNSKLRKWIDNRFAPAKPFTPSSGSREHNTISPNIKEGSLIPRKRLISDSDSSGSMGETSTMGPKARSGYERSISWGLDKQFDGTLTLSSARPQSASHRTQHSDFLTEEQRRIVDTDLKQGSLMKIRAFAGTGKTRSLVEYARKRPRKSFLYVAFNASARMDAEKKFGGNVTCRTMHATALRELESISPVACAAKLANTMPIPDNWGAKDLIILFQLDKHSTIIEALENPSNHMLPGERRKGRGAQLESSISTQKIPFPTATTVATTIKITLERFWASTLSKITKYFLPGTMIEKVGLKPASVLRWAKLVWFNIEQGTAPWLPHDAYLKLMQLYPTGDNGAFGSFETIMFDEAQDATSCMASIILRQLHCGRSVIVVGDPYQKIYGFRNACNDCFDDELYPPTHTYFLTHSFRFGDNIAHIANTLLRALKEPQRVRGVRRHDTVKLAPTSTVLNRQRLQPPRPQSEPFTIIFRKNITLISTAISFCLSHPHHKIRLGLNRSFSKHNLFANLRSAHALLKGTRAKSGPLAEWKTWDQLRDHVSAASESGDDTPPLLLLVVGLEDKLQSDDFLTHLSSLERNVVNDNDTTSADVIFVTAHQSKGLEWDRVHVAAWDFNPVYKKRSALCKGSFIREECGLLYVAVTRARKELLVAEPVTSYLAAEEGVVDIRLSPKTDDGKCERCENEWKDGWLLLKMTRTGLEPGCFDAEVQEVGNPETDSSTGIVNSNPSSQVPTPSSSPSSNSSRSTYSDPFTPAAAPPLSPSLSLMSTSSAHPSGSTISPAFPKKETITICAACSHITEQFLASFATNNHINTPVLQRSEFLKSRWRPMVCWDQAWAERYEAETLRIKQGLRRSGFGGEEEGDQEGNGTAGLGDRELITGWWGQKEE
ncbi:P-loop containing nucleoside triphosphate hydrolase protein [Ascodesmis nigricans]|uniref:DNA 3'-5' helicase n=1 Tax=Ascodesmis nigricans TaxID=341454 RepID=A0A4S2N4L6_9PEZI|nr:P-loop containing nucleoside triphosphate hydrolase protein [Ascodesmis nigricans]